MLQILFKNGQNRFGRSDKSIFGRFGRFFLNACKLLILNTIQTAKKTDTTAKNISKNGRQNPLRGFGVSVNVGLGLFAKFVLYISLATLACYVLFGFTMFVIVLLSVIIETMGVNFV